MAISATMRNHRLLLLLIAMSLGGAEAIAQPFAIYGEPHRPQFHFSPAENWTNEPCGLVYNDGTYHLFYQANPFNNQFGNQSWGHATSDDLIHWQQESVAITPEEGILIYSGSTVVDENNTAGFGAGAMVAIYTGYNPADGTQDQRLAYSTDDGTTWAKYAGNPVISRLPGTEGVEARDPKVFWHGPTSEWKMVLAHGGQKKISIWSSPDLTSWTRTHDFVANDIAGQTGPWEVPDLFELPIKEENGSITGYRWVLSATANGGSPAGGNGVIYFVGVFNGFVFANLNPAETVLWADHGRDFDGQQSWNNAPGGRVIWTSVMQSYGNVVPTTPWRGQMAVPRELHLMETSEGHLRIVQTPVAEITALRGTATSLSNVQIVPGADPLDALNVSGDQLEVVATFDLGTATTFGLHVRENGSERTTVGYDVATHRIFVDRGSSGDQSFHPHAGGIHYADLKPDDGLVKLHVLVDRNTVEVFGNNGLVSISNLIFPDAASGNVSAFSAGGASELVSIDIYPLASIWNQGSAPDAGADVIARWSMDALPQAIGVPWNGPVSIDDRNDGIEGEELGTGNALYEPDPATDNLWSEGMLMTTSSDVPPAAMFTIGNEGGSESYDAGSLVNQDGSLHLPVALYGDDAAFDSAFSVEMFFRTHGDQSTAGRMQLLLQGETRFRYGLIVNEAGPGSIRFAINDDAGSIEVVDADSRNYADGQWHYLLAEYNPAIAANGELSLTITNEDGSSDVVVHTIGGQFQGLPAASDGDLLIGRHNRQWLTDHRTFIGLIDEVQLTRNLVADEDRLGAFLTDPVAPNSMAIERGTQLNGSVEDAALSDDQRVEVQRQTGLSRLGPLSIVFEGQLRLTTPYELSFEIESKASNRGLKQSVFLYNWSTGGYDLFDTSTLDLVDDELTINIGADYLDYIEPALGLVRARVSVNPAPRAVVGRQGWAIEVDKVRWLVD